MNTRSIATENLGTLLIAVAAALAAYPAYSQEAVSSKITLGTGTTNVVIVSPGAIVAGVDSKETYKEYRSDGTVSVQEGTACKARQAGPYYITVAGIDQDADGPILNFAQSAYVPGDTLDSLAARLAASLPSRLAALLERVRATSDDAFRALVKDEILQLALMGAEKGKPRAVVLSFSAATAGSGPIAVAGRLMTCPGNCETPQTAYFLGVHEAIDRAVASDPSRIGHADEAHLRALIDLEYHSRPDVVGGPVSLIRTDGRGPVLVSPGACAGSPPPLLRTQTDETGTGFGAAGPLIAELDRQLAAARNVVFDQETDRYFLRGSKLHTDVVTATIGLVDGAEKYDAIRCGNKTYGSIKDVQGPFMTGELATVLRVTRDALARGNSLVSHDFNEAGEPVVTARFHASAPAMGWLITVAASTYTLDFDGTALFSDDTGRLLEITWRARPNLLGCYGIETLSWTTSFTSSMVGGAAIVVPVKSSYRVAYSTATHRSEWTESTFSNYRRFGATAELKFDSLP
jgi:hypothetical protein